jgi:putative NIF3 family GTP cyclohydrolase 1 type 2
LYWLRAALVLRGTITVNIAEVFEHTPLDNASDLVSKLQAPTLLGLLTT